MAMHASGLLVEARFAYESGDVERAKRLCSMILQLLPSSAESNEAAAYLDATRQGPGPASHYQPPAAGDPR